MPCLQTTCITSFTDVNLHQSFLSDRFEGLMLFTNFYFPPLFNALYCGDQLQQMLVH